MKNGCNFATVNQTKTVCKFIEILKTANRKKGFVGLLGAFSAYLLDKYKPWPSIKVTA